MGLVFRLYHIDFPALGWHSWRQSDTAAIAKNLYENGFNFLYPQINWNANGTGYVESEFHIYPLIVSILYSVFGVNDMFGRIVSLLFSLLTIYGIYILVRKILNENIAAWSSFIYAILPLNIFYGRAFMPEAAMLMCSLYSVYFFNEWLEKEKIKYFLFAGFFTCFAVLIKLPALYLGLPLLYLSYINYGIKTIRNLKLWLFVIIVLIPVTLWYYHAHQLYLNNGVTFGIWSFGSSKWGMFGQLLDPSFYHKIFLMDLAERHFTYPGFILLLLGLFVKRKFPKELLFDIWLIAVLVYFFIVSEGNRVHEYYQLPFVLPAVIFTGKILNKLLPLVILKIILAAIN